MKLYVSFFLFFYYSVIFSQITVDNSQTANDLVQLLLNNSGCASVSNFQVFGNNSYGSFSRNGSSFPFENGVVLSTGFVANIPGPNNTLSDDNLGTPNDADLNYFFSDTHDTTVLEFDFVPLTNYMSFSYIFASEEYQEGNSGTCNYSDVFAFLIKKDTDVDYHNIAIIPNTTIPVQVTTVHPEIPGSCQAENEIYFGTWNSQTDVTIPINFNGQTTVLKAESLVSIGETYHIKLIIADHSNYRYDSAVFLKAGGFSIGTDLGIDLLRNTENPLCNNETIILDSNITAAISYEWFVDTLPYNGVFTQIVGENNSNYTVTSEGKYKVRVDLGSGCISEGEVTIEYENSPITTDTELIHCVDNDSNLSVFDLTEANDTITNNDESLIIQGFYTSIVKAENKNDAINNILSYSNTVQDEIIYVRVENQYGCFSIAKLTLTVFENPKLDRDLIVTYCLNTYPSQILLESGLISDSTDIIYSWSYDNGTDYINLNSNTPTIETNETGVYKVSVTNSDNCTVHRNITVIPSNVAVITDLIVSETIYSKVVSIQVEVTGEGDYIYAMDDSSFQESSIFNNVSYGYHKITVKDKNGCMPNTEEEITILNYKKFFTPNNDGKNDYWNLITNSLLVHYNTISNIIIYDRFGKIIADIDPKGKGWDGTYKGIIVSPQDYWFRLELIDTRGEITIKTGHFSLVSI